MDKIAIVILNWNGAAMLCQYLPSVMKYSRDEAAVYVADNGSDDDSLDMLRRDFPDCRITSISYNYIDYRFRNDTQNTYQLRLWTDDEYLCGELRAMEQQPHTFHIHAENEFFSRENGVVYRNGEVYRDIIDRTSGLRLDSQLIRTNHARVMYECPPTMVIREENNNHL